MNSESRDVLNNGFIMEFERLDITITDSEVDNYFLETSDKEYSLVEHVRRVKSLRSEQLVKTNGNSMESYHSTVEHDVTSEKTIKHLNKTPTSEDQSIAITCKKIYKDLMRPITSKLDKLTFKKNVPTQQPAKTQKKFKIQFQTKETDAKMSKNKIKFRIVPNLTSNSTCLDMIPSEFDKRANNLFTSYGDFVCYNV